MQKKILTAMPVITGSDNITPTNVLDARRHKLAVKRARKAVGNTIVGESKAARRMRRRNGG